MRSAAQRQEDDPGPEPAGLDARAAAVLDAHLALIERADALLGTWRDACPQDSQAVPALRELITETIGAGLHAEEMRQALAAQTATAWTLDAAFAAGRAAERAAAESSPGPRHAAEPRRKGLRLVGGGGVAAFAGAAFTGLRHAWAVHPVATAAAGFTAATALAATTAVVAPHAAATFGAGGPAVSPAPAASIYSATPFPVVAPSSQLIANVMHRDGKGPGGSSRTLSVPLSPSLPAYVPPPASVPADDGSDPSSSQDPASAPVVVEGQLSVSTSALDLTGTGTGSITLSCSGGPCPFHLVPGTDVSADTGRGHLQDGQSVTVNLTIDPAALLLGGASTVRIWPGDVTVAITWSVPAVPSVVPSALPTDLPTVLPTDAGS